MKKKIISSILCGVLLLTGITACNSEAPAIGTVQTTASQSETTATTTTAGTTTATEAAATTEATTTATEAATTTTEATTTTAETTAATTEATTTSATTAATTTTTKAPETTATTTKKPETTTTTTTAKKPDPTPAPVSSEGMNFAKNMIPGYNIGNQLEANSGGTPNETAWGNPKISETLVKAIKDAGFKSVRVPVSYLSKIGNGPDYTIDSAWLDRIQQVVDMCLDNGLYVIINVHGDGYKSVGGGWLLCDAADQDTICKKFAKLWEQVAKRFENYSEKLVFESMNEVFDGTYGYINPDYYKNINRYNQVFVDTIRKAGGKNPDRYLLVPGWNTDINSTVAGSDFVLPKDSRNHLMVSVHYYDPWIFCGQETAKGYFKWGDTVGKNAKRNASEKYMEGQLDKLVSSFTSKGIPVIIGEYGSIDKTYADPINTIYRAYFAEYLTYAAAKRGIVTVLWDNGYNGKNGFGVFDRKTGKQTQPEIIAAIIKGAKADYNITPPTE